MSQLKILPVKHLQEPKRKRKIHKVLPQPPFLCCLAAGVASGKSTFIVNCLYRFYPKYFGSIWWISPSVENDKTTWMLREDETIMLVSEGLEDIDQILLGIQEKQKEDDENDEMDDVLIILDDCLGYLRNKAIEKLCAKFRHYKISMFIAVQNFRMLPVTCRYNAQYWCIWHLNSKKELAKIVDEMDQSFPDFLKYYEEGTGKKRYSFIYCDMKKQVIRENFGKILYEKDKSYGKEKSPKRTSL